MLDFATSSDLLATVANYPKFIPALSTTFPPGIRFVLIVKGCVGFKAAKALEFGTARDYRVSDREVYSTADPKDTIEFCYPRGTALFIDSSACFHFGSRNSVKPRTQLMLGYAGVCRTISVKPSFRLRFIQPAPPIPV